MSLDQLLEELRKIFGDSKSVLEKRRLFERRRWRADEPFPVYFQDKMILAKPLELQEIVLLEYLIEGLND